MGEFILPFIFLLNLTPALYIFSEKSSKTLLFLCKKEKPQKSLIFYR